MPTPGYLQGRLELCIVESLDTERLRGIVRSLENFESYACIFNTSPTGGALPRVGSVVAVYNKQNWWYRYLFTISEPLNTSGENAERTIDEILSGQEELPGDVPRLKGGESYLGRDGRIVFDDGGNIRLTNRGTNLSLTLNEELSKVTLSGNNIAFSTPGEGIRILTESSVPDTFGDSIRIEKNVPAPAMPEEVSNVAPTLSNITHFEIDKLGAFNVSVLQGNSTFEMDAIGNIDLGNQVAGLGMSALGDIDLANDVAFFSMTALGDVTLRNNIGTLKVSQLGLVELSNKLSSLDMDPAGVVNLNGTKVDIVSTSTATIEATAEAALEAAAIRLGKVATNHVALSELTSVYLNLVQAFLVIVKTHTHAVAGTVTTGLGVGGLVVGTASASSELAAAPAPPPSTPTLVGSTTVTAQL